MVCFRPPWWLGDGSVAITAWAVAALTMGLVCGAVRERSGSVWAAVITHTRVCRSGVGGAVAGLRTLMS